MPHGWVGALLVGPAVFAVLLGILGCLLLCAVGVKAEERLFAVVERAWGRLERHRAVPMLWGLSAAVLVFAASAVLVSTHVLALAGLLLLLAGLAYAGLGLAVTARAVGTALAEPLGGQTALPASLPIGLVVLLLASILPVIGWILVLLAVAAGTGAVLEALLARG